jgi:hypothetical protein
VEGGEWQEGGAWDEGTGKGDCWLANFLTTNYRNGNIDGLQVFANVIV